jgi:hypothetical protein
MKNFVLVLVQKKNNVPILVQTKNFVLTAPETGNIKLESAFTAFGCAVNYAPLLFRLRARFALSHVSETSSGLLVSQTSFDWYLVPGTCTCTKSRSA